MAALHDEAFFAKAAQVLAPRELNPSQAAAVGAPPGPTLVEAGPGSGKTTVLVWRVVYLLAVVKAPPEKVCVVTFTKAAADEMAARLRGLVRGAARVPMGTIHSLARRLRREVGLAPDELLGDGARLDAAADLLRKHRIPVTDDVPGLFLQEVDAFRNRLQSPEEHTPAGLRSGPLRRREVFARVAREFVDGLRAHRKKDYDGWLEQLYDVARREPDRLRGRFDHVLIDEFQDTSLLQYELLRRLVGPGKGMYVVGDQDQSIYGWRGAGPEVFHKFPRDYPGARRIALDVNYRATPALVRTTNRLIEHNGGRGDKRIRAAADGTGAGAAPSGGSDCDTLGDRAAATTRPTDRSAAETLRPADDAEEASVLIGHLQRLRRERGTPWSEMAVVYRRNEQALAFIARCARLGTPMNILGNPPSPFHSWIGQDVLSYVRLALGERRPNLLERIMYRPNRFISAADTRLAGGLWRGGASMTRAFAGLGLNGGQRRRIAELERDLVRLGGLPPRDAVAHLREVVGYDEYLAQRTADDGAARAEAFAQVALIETVAAGFDELDEFVAFGLSTRGDPKNWWRRFAAQTDGEPRRDALTLTTCHSAKGLEFDVVAVAGLVEDVLPGTGSDLEEERRLAYVAMTRARHTLFLSAPRRLLGEPRDPSRFIVEATGVDLTARDRPGGRGRGPEGEGRYVVDVPYSAGPRVRRSLRDSAELAGSGGRRAASAAAKWRPGVKVRHAIFGAGEVVALRTGRGATVTVKFVEHGEKTLVVEDVLNKRLLETLE